MSDQCTKPAADVAAELPDRGPLSSLEVMLFSAVGLAAPYDCHPPPVTHPAWSGGLLRAVMAGYLVLTGGALSGLLVATMTDTLRRNQVSSIGESSAFFLSPSLFALPCFSLGQ